MVDVTFVFSCMLLHFILDRGLVCDNGMDSYMYRGLVEYYIFLFLNKYQYSRSSAVAG
jgi:hypothetical protein